MACPLIWCEMREYRVRRSCNLMTPPAKLSRYLGSLTNPTWESNLEKRESVERQRTRNSGAGSGEEC